MRSFVPSSYDEASGCPGYHFQTPYENRPRPFVRGRFSIDRDPFQPPYPSPLSGGERNRLHLAMALKEEGNVLLLDEPTNDIDVNTLRALEEGLEDFAGCAVVISHDRWFLDRICTHILAFEGDSNVFYFEGSYSEYEENKLKRLGNEEPKRVRYRKLIAD